MVLRRHYRHLREELAKLKPPRGLEDLDAPFNPVATLPPMDVSSTTSATTTINAQVGTDDSLVPELNLMVDNGDSDMSMPADFFKDMKDEGLLTGEEEVVEILSDTENESSVWQDKEEDTP